jgi:hypothetical protein
LQPTPSQRANTLLSTDPGVVDGADVKSATANETWTISLAKSSRTVSITLEGMPSQCSRTDDLSASSLILLTFFCNRLPANKIAGKVIQQQQRGTLLHSLGFAATSIYALFSRGVVQV